MPQGQGCRYLPQAQGAAGLTEKAEDISASHGAAPSSRSTEATCGLLGDQGVHYGRRRASTAQGAHGPIGSSCDRDVERFSFVCTVGRSSGKPVSPMGVSDRGRANSSRAARGSTLRKATCGPVPRSHKPYKVAGPRLSRRIYQPRANQDDSETMARMMATNARARPLARSNKTETS